MEFNPRMEAFIAARKSVPLAHGTGEMFYPGELEARNDARNRAGSLRLPDDTPADLRWIATETGLVGLSPPLTTA